jgi:D-glycero-D-manno-heptose 1,7-bisphosphate phosphatase
MSGRQAVFLDRDGVLNRNVFYSHPGGYEAPRIAADFVLFPWVVEALSPLQAVGYGFVLVSNQPNFAKGKSSMEDLLAIHERLLRSLEGHGIELLASSYCYHHPDSKVDGYSACDCRKPSARFLLEAAQRFDLDLAKSWMVGDRATDVECGRRAGVRTIRVRPDYPLPGWEEELPKPDFVVENLLEASGLILKDR